ncbi:PTS system mannose/fructose/sorbose family transporter subunit IID [Sporolactobacillus shoreicorticis]|uniref:PTS system mannose/fructose/sorbose family transporter subunit IID n=1 Tax=Sporolactobacillus shoreicorticis TaxID=1923877 RepID=A0ABW5S2B7_9BACL|nr:PTS system mannose/fructose/sorbose family transporter subunit IID [Sporolactobacillus shoreicorticis]MCO7124664.1 PTS system mannose/fructose/sorbose family transporter subunit IID [Sporolactobacillus shoreicorticis]
MSKSNLLKLEGNERKLIWQLFWRANPLMFCTSYTKQQGVTFAWALIPFLQRIYGKDSDEFYKSLGRHQSFFNTTPGMAPFIMGLVISMEEERKRAIDTFDNKSIEALKASLMGPLAGIGDSIYVGTLRIVATGVAIGLCQQGSILGPIIFALVYNIPNFLIRYYGSIVGYKAGSKFIGETMANGTFKVLTKAFSVMGLMMVGAMSAQYVKFDTVFATKLAGQSFKLQTILDSILPGLLPLSLVVGSFFYLRKKNKPVRVMVFIFVLAVVLTVLGITGVAPTK